MVMPKLNRGGDEFVHGSGIVACVHDRAPPIVDASLRAGDLIVGVGDKSITSPAEATRAIRESLKTSQAVALRIVRDGQATFVVLSPSDSDQSAAGGDDGQGDQDQDR